MTHFTAGRLRQWADAGRACPTDVLTAAADVIDRQHQQITELLHETGGQAERIRELETQLETIAGETGAW
jgi:hypothetical protein